MALGMRGKYRGFPFIKVIPGRITQDFPGVFALILSKSPVKRRTDMRKMNQNQSSATLTQLVSDIGLDAVLPQLAERVQNPKSRLAEKAASGWTGEPEEFPVRRYHPQTRLFCALLRAAALYPYYEEKGIPYEVFCNTMGDIALRAALYKEADGMYGLTVSDAVWLRHHLAGKLFRLGQLQFQLFEMFPYELLEEDGYMTFSEEAKLRFPTGTPVLNVHIPARTVLTPEECDRSFALAESFFPRFFPEYHAKAYLCFSWLLYPGMRALLAEDSNIARFAERFSIIGESGDCGEALCRIYGKRYRRKADYPRNTALQKTACDHLSCLGEACGIIVR